MSNSKLVDCVVYSPNHSGKRTHAVDRITPHCTVGQLSAEAIGNCFAKKARKASCNYGIGNDGRVALVVDEENRSWCSSSNSNDQRAITIECASDKTEPYTFNDAVYDKLVMLCVDICQRYGKTKLLWIADKGTTLAYEPKADEMLLTVHRWFSNKSCPGAWMYEHMGQLAATVTEKLGGTPQPAKQPQLKSVDEVAKEVINGSWENGAERKQRLEAAGYNYEEVREKVNKLLKKVENKTPTQQPQLKSVDEVAKEVISGSWGNGAERKQRLEAAGYNYEEVREKVNKFYK